MKEIIDLKNWYQLMKLGFKPNMYIGDNHADKLYEHMTDHDMVYLKGSDGTIVDKYYGMFFNRVEYLERNYLELCENSDYYGLNHKNVLYSSDYGFSIVTSSPHRDLFTLRLNVPNCQVFVINPFFLDYFEFLGSFEDGCNLAYVHDNYLADFYELKEEMENFYGFRVFINLGG